MAHQSPRFVHLAQTLTAEIAQGKYPLGTTIPTEEELCRQFGTSRHTVRAAVERLVTSGLVTRKTRVGTVVQRLTALPQDFRMAVGGIEELLQHSAATRMRVVERELRVVTANDNEPLRKHAGEHWLFVRGLRFSDDVPAPICVNEVWVHPDFRAVSGVEGDLRASVFDLISKEFKIAIAQVIQEIHAAKLPDNIARALQVPLGSAGLWVQRQYLAEDGRLIELALSIHPPEIFRYRMTLNRAAQR